MGEELVEGANLQACAFRLAYPQTQLQRCVAVEVALPNTEDLGPEAFDHVHQPRSQDILFCPRAKHPAALPQTAIQRALLAGEGLQDGRQASR